MSSGFFALLRRLFGRAPAAPVSPRPRPSGSARPPGAPNVVYRDQVTRPAAPTMRWKKERFSLPSLHVHQWARRASTRQKILVAAAALSLAALSGVAVSRLRVQRILPAAVHGIWTTDTPAYADRRFELRARAVAFTTGAPNQPVLPLRIVSVKTTAAAEGTHYRVAYLTEGEPALFQFQVTGGASPTIRFANQPLLIWRRVLTRETMIPAAF